MFRDAFLDLVVWEGGGGPASSRDCTRAFTILELLIALLLLILIGGLVIPISIAAIARASAQEAGPRIEMAVAQARLESARRAAPVRLRASARGSILRIEAFHIESETADARGTDTMPAELFVDIEPLWNETTRTRGEWTLLDEVTLPPGMILAQTDATPEDIIVFGAVVISDTPAGESADELNTEEPVESWTVAIALPDGQVGAGEPTTLRVADRTEATAWSISFSPWTGQVTLTPIQPEPEPGEEEDDGPPPPEPTPEAFTRLAPTGRPSPGGTP